MNKNKGFTIIELLVAITIFAIISVLSYRIISSLLKTKEVVEGAQEKWGGVSTAIFMFNNAWMRTIPLVVRGENGFIMPAFIGKNKLDSRYDAQIELTENGFVGDQIAGISPPKRVGFRYNQGKLYLITWPVLNRVATTIPQVNLLTDHVAKFKAEFLYPDGQWRDTWPLSLTNLLDIPQALRITIDLDSGEEVIKQWSI